MDLEVPIPTAHELLAAIRQAIPLEANASLLVTEIGGKPAGWQTFTSDAVLEHYYRRHHPAD